METAVNVIGQIFFMMLMRVSGKEAASGYTQYRKGQCTCGFGGKGRSGTENTLRALEEMFDELREVEEACGYIFKETKQQLRDEIEKDWIEHVQHNPEAKRLYWEADRYRMTTLGDSARRSRPCCIPLEYIAAGIARYLEAKVNA